MRTGDIRDSVLDNRKAKQLLGWSPGYDIKQGLREYYQLMRRQEV
jgi:UDP-glucose 4-epimerase